MALLKLEAEVRLLEIKILFDPSSQATETEVTVTVADTRLPLVAPLSFPLPAGSLIDPAAFARQVLDYVTNTDTSTDVVLFPEPNEDGEFLPNDDGR